MHADDAAQDWSKIQVWRKAMRQELLEKRLAISAADRITHSEIVTAELNRMLESANSRMVGFYWPFKGEYDPRPMVRTLQAQGMRFALPVVIEKAQPLVFREWRPEIRMSHGIWNIPIPAEGDPVLPDLLLVPLLGFDGQGYRLGYGGGFYDRTLAAASVKPRTIGIGFDRLKLATIYPHPHDIAMDCVVTEHGSGRSQSD